MTDEPRSAGRTTRRLGTSFALYLVMAVLGRTLANAGVAPVAAYQPLVATVIVDIRLLWSFFRRPKLAARTA
ncbi:MAG TPA: hypothetical protein VMJ10_28680 [Kofleriaceae bacterium]|nr:hypothetical protein [Kofleriaceae bacterium]